MEEPTPHTPSAKRVFWGFLPAIALSVLMMVLLVFSLVLQLTATVLDGASRVLASGAYWAIGTSPPPGKWPRERAK